MKVIDIPVEGWIDSYLSPDDKVALGKQYYQDGDLTNAQALWEEASSCGNNQAAFLLAILAKRQNRYKEAERLLLRLRTRHTGLEGRIDLELSDLYHRAGMPVSALGFLLMARNAGEEVCDIEKYHRAFKHSAIDAETDLHGAYVLGSALVQHENGSLREKGIYYLTQAIRHGQGQQWCAYAALNLAEAAVGYDDALCSEAFRMAEEIGNPHILKK